MLKVLHSGLDPENTFVCTQQHCNKAVKEESSLCVTDYKSVQS